MSQEKIAVKVGNKSASRYRNAKVYRAVTVKELIKLVEIENISIIVIENIRDNEYTAALEFITNYISDSSHKVFFFVPDNNDTTTGLADELSLDIYLDIKDLYAGINNVCGINVDNDITITSVKIETEEADGFDTEFGGEFGSLLDIPSTFDNTIYDVTEELHISGKRALGNYQLSKNELDIEEVVEPEIQTEQPIVLAKEDEIAEETEAESEIKVADTAEIAQLREENANNIELIKKLQLDLGTATRNLEDANSKNSRLSKLIKAIKDERNTYQAELARFEASDIVEDPITISEFNSAKEEIEELKRKIEISGSHSDAELKAVTDERDRLIDQVKELEDSNAEAEGQIESLQLTKISLEKQLKDALDSTAYDNEIRELRNKLDEVNRELENTKEILRNTHNSLESKNREIEELNRNIQAITENYITLTRILGIALDKLRTVNELETQVEDYYEQNIELSGEVNRLNAELADSLANLERTRNETETRVELARNFAKEDLDQTKRDNVALRGQVNALSIQLKEAQARYQGIVSMAGIDESGAVTIRESNKILEATANTLREQLANMKQAYESSENSKAELSMVVNNLTAEKDKLNTLIKAMSSNFTGGAGVGNIPPFDYSGRGLVVCITGTGSYGITTTAFSMAMMLANNSRVIYVDFDLLAAKADSWFGKSPLVNGVPGYPPHSPVASGLGVAIDRGVPFMVSQAGRCIQPGIATKNGCLDYLSGLYTRPDVVKLISCDYGGLITYLGNSYDYVIIDFGRIGASDINNQILKNFSDIARSTVMVTLSDKLEIRNGRIEIQKAKLNIEKIAWLVNMSESTRLDDKTKGNISPAPYVILPFVEDFYGKRKNFNMSRSTKDKFSVFVNNYVLRG